MNIKTDTMTRHILIFLASAFITTEVLAQSYKIVDTDVTECYNASSIVSPPTTGQAFYGQDCNYNGNQPSYIDYGDGTISDNITGLMWEQDMGVKISYSDAFTKATNSNLGGHNDWRVPTIKELYSLAFFSGRCEGDYVADKFIDTNYFIHPIGDTNIGEREIDAQTWSSTQYTGLTMTGGDTTVFGYNFVDGRLKGYPKYDPQSGQPATMYFRLVRGNTAYGINNFSDNGDGTISDNATELMWEQSDDGTQKNWEASLSYCENLSLGSHTDWRMPNAKELHSIVDYSRSPDATNSPAIDPIFSCTSFLNPGNNLSYGYYWTSSPLKDGVNPFTDAAYICFGEAQGEMESPPNSGNFSLVDTHGAGAQRNDPKEKDSGTTYPSYWGPQGDIVYVDNFVRCVRDISTSNTGKADNNFDNLNICVFPNPTADFLTIKINQIERDEIKIELLDLAGKCISRTKIKPENTVAYFDIKTIVAGTYFIKVSNNRSNYINKVVITKN